MPERKESFYAKIKVSAFVNFEEDLKKKKKKKMMIKISKWRCGTFRMSLHPCILHTLRVCYGSETLVELVMCLKRLKTVGFRSSEPFHL